MPTAAARLRRDPGRRERAKGEVQVKDLVEGARLSAEITDNAAWREGRPAQVTVAEGELVATVQRILAAQAEERVEGGQGALLIPLRDLLRLGGGSVGFSKGEKGGLGVIRRRLQRRRPLSLWGRGSARRERTT